MSKNQQEMMYSIPEMAQDIPVKTLRLTEL